MTYERIRLTFDGPVAVLTLAHPATLNAMSRQMLTEMRDALDVISAPARDARCVVLTGEGRAFCSGANLSDGDIGASGAGFDASALLDEVYHPVLRRFRALGRPLVTALNGATVGVGMSFALMGDLIFAAKSAYFLQAFRRIGLIPDGGATWLLPRLIGLARAKELSFLAEKLPAEKALDWGLINRVYDDDALMPRTMALAHDLAAGASVALGHLHRLYAESPDNSYEEQLARERDAQKLCGQSHDFAEGLAAFAEKRPPNFEGR